MTSPLRIAERDGQLTWTLTCPRCGQSGEIDQDQAAGRVSSVHDCGWHETVDWLARHRHDVSWQPVLRAVREGRLTLGGAAAFLDVTDLEIERAAGGATEQEDSDG